MRTPNFIQKICELWKADEVHGIERFWDTGLLVLRCVSLSYWWKDDLVNRSLDRRGISDTRSRRILRDNRVEFYCISQLIVILGLLWFRSSTLGLGITAYVLFEIYLNLFSIVFLPRRKEFVTPKSSEARTAVNEPSTSVERSLLLLFVNILQVTLAFAVFYRASRPGLLPQDAFRDSSFVFGTIGAPPYAPGPLVGLQIFLDFLLIAVILGTFVGQAGPFAKK